MHSLYIVATPIGNMQDITIRAIKTLFSANLILTENPAKTSLLLKKIKQDYPGFIQSGYAPKLVLFNEYLENEKPDYFLNLFSENDVVLISEAGTPLISDPGYKLVRLAIKNGVKVISVPGATAAISSLLVSGLPTDKFCFLGFLPKAKAKKIKMLNNLKRILHDAGENGLLSTIILYESPHRVLATLEIISKVFGNINIVVCRELTKVFEEVLRDNIEEIIKLFTNKNLKGEFTILFNLKINS